MCCLFAAGTRRATDLVLTGDAAALSRLEAADKAAAAMATDADGGAVAIAAGGGDEDESRLRASLGLSVERPRTAGGGGGGGGLAAIGASASPRQPAAPASAGGGPPPPTVSPAAAAAAATAAVAAAAATASACGGASAEPARGRTLVLTVLSTWGDAAYFGLAGLQVLDADGHPIPLTREQLTASPRDLSELSGGGGGGGGGDPRTVDKLLDGTNATTDASHMWLAPWEPATGRAHTLTISLPAARTVAALRVWNYNKSEEDASRGVRMMHAALDGVPVSPPGCLMLRRGPGHDRFDHGQLIPLLPLLPPPGGGEGREQPHAPPMGDEGGGAGGGGGGGGGGGWGAPMPMPMPMPWIGYAPVAQDYWAPVRPRGHLWQLRLLSTHGDLHYMGLDGLQLIDERGYDLTTGAACEAPSHPHAPRIHAHPTDVNALPEVSGDPRHAGKLFVGGADGGGADGEGALPCAPPPAARKPPSDTWLAPWSLKAVNELWLVFEEPTALSLVRVLNYSKDAARGVHEFELLADGLLVYRGWLRPGGGGGGGDGRAAGWQTIALTDEPAVLEHERRSGRLPTMSDPEADTTLLINDGQVMSTGNGGALVPASAPAPSFASAGSAGLSSRPTTACASPK